VNLDKFSRLYIHKFDADKEGFCVFAESNFYYDYEFAGSGMNKDLIFECVTKEEAQEWLDKLMEQYKDCNG